MDRTISELPSASAINDASLIPIEQSGDAMSITGALVKSYAQGAITGLTATATTLAAGSQATVTKTVQSGTLRLTFGIPRGDTGATGPSGSGTGDMVASVYDPAGGARQVAFADEITQGMESFSRKNLLDNWYFVGGGSQLGGGKFPINQRGETSWSDTNIMSVDRWVTRKTGGTLALSVAADGLHYAGSGESAKGFNQPLENIDQYLGKTVTISILCKDVSVSTDVCMRWGIFNSSARNSHVTPRGTTYVTADGLYSVTTTLPSTFNYSFLNVGFYQHPNTTASLTIVAAKLELGDTQTLAHQVNGEWVLNELPNYQEQLARCQRHLYVMNTAGNSQATFGIGQTSANTEVQVYIPFPVTMREAPTFSSAGSFETTSGGVATAVSTMACLQARNTPDGAVVYTMDTTRSLTPGTAARLAATSASARLIFSAEL